MIWSDITRYQDKADGRQLKNGFHRTDRRAQGNVLPCLQKKPCLMLPIMSGSLDIGFLYGFCSL